MVEKGVFFHPLLHITVGVQQEGVPVCLSATWLICWKKKLDSSTVQDTEIGRTDHHCQLGSRHRAVDRRRVERQPPSFFSSIVAVDNTSPNIFFHLPPFPTCSTITTHYHILFLTRGCILRFHLLFNIFFFFFKPLYESSLVQNVHVSFLSPHLFFFFVLNFF